jgi:hypothetical protein
LSFRLAVQDQFCESILHPEALNQLHGGEHFELGQTRTLSFEARLQLCERSHSLHSFLKKLDICNYSHSTSYPETLARLSKSNLVTLWRCLQPSGSRLINCWFLLPKLLKGHCSSSAYCPLRLASETRHYLHRKAILATVDSNVQDGTMRSYRAFHLISAVVSTNPL